MQRDRYKSGMVGRLKASTDQGRKFGRPAGSWLIGELPWKVFGVGEEVAFFWFTRKRLTSAKEIISEILGLIKENDKQFRREKGHMYIYRYIKD